MTTPVQADSSVQFVDLPGGRVTLQPFDQLVTRRDQLTSQVAELGTQSAQMAQDAGLKERQAGAILVVQRTGLNTPEVSDDLAKCDELTGQIDQIDAQLAELSGLARTGFTGFFKRFGDQQRRGRLIEQRDRLAALVPAALQSLAQHAPQSTVPEADGFLVSARTALANADQLRQTAQTLQAESGLLADEIARRREAIDRMGFDALWTAAWLQNHEPPAIQSPVTLKPGETAWVSAAAVLSRQATRTQWTGSSQGFSFPIGHTGIRYRVGSYRGHPIQSTIIKDIDSGSLVLTNQRLVFVGRLKSVIVGLSHIVHVEAYTDSLGVFQDRRETPDFFKLQSPQYVLFYLNYALGRLS